MFQTDEKYFRDGQTFKPERWLRASDGQPEGEKSVNPFAFLPFGFGSRMCVGRRFAETEMQIIAARYVVNLLGSSPCHICINLWCEFSLQNPT